MRRPHELVWLALLAGGLAAGIRTRPDLLSKGCHEHVRVFLGNSGADKLAGGTGRAAPPYWAPQIDGLTGRQAVIPALLQTRETLASQLSLGCRGLRRMFLEPISSLFRRQPVVRSRKAGVIGPFVRDLSKVGSTLWRWQGIHFPAWP